MNSTIERFLMLRLSIALFFLKLFIASAIADDIPIEAEITGVTIYQDMAGVVRDGQVTIPAGNHMLVFTGLTEDLDTDSLALAILSRNLLIGAVEVDKVHGRDVAVERERALREQISQLNDRSRAIDDEMAAAGIQLSFLESLAQGYAKDAWQESVSGSADPAKWQSAVTFLGTGAIDAKKSIRDGELKKRELAKDIDALRRELQQIATGRKASYTIRVAASTNAPVTADIRLTYRVEDASWRPRYDFRIDTDTKKLDIILSADVWQNTGENWNNIALALSTSQPSENIDAPEIDPVFMNIIEPFRRRTEMAPAADFNEAEVDQIVVTGSSLNQASLDITGFSAIYRIEAPVSLASGANEQSYILSEEQEDTTLKIRAVPKYDPTGYLYATFEYSGKSPLFAGTASIFRDGDFVGTNNLDLIRPGEKTDLALGRDELLEITYDYDGGERSDSGIFNRTQREDRKYLIEVTNRHTRAVDVEIADQWPVPQDEDIEVEPLQSATPPTEKHIEGEPGIIYWRGNLAAGETMTIRHHYRISYPEGKVLTER